MGSPLWLTAREAVDGRADRGSFLPRSQNKWLRSINKAVDEVLGGGGEGSSPGVMGISRTASYTFTGEGRFKDAKYSGGWLAGRVHGRSASVCVCCVYVEG